MHREQHLQKKIEKKKMQSRANQSTLDLVFFSCGYFSVEAEMPIYITVYLKAEIKVKIKIHRFLSD